MLSMLMSVTTRCIHIVLLLPGHSAAGMGTSQTSLHDSPSTCRCHLARMFVSRRSSAMTCCYTGTTFDCVDGMRPVTACSATVA